MPKGVKQNTPEKIEQRKHGMKLPENADKDRRWTREEIIPIVEKIILSDPDIVFFYDVWSQTPFQKDWYYKLVGSESEEHKYLQSLVDSNKIAMKKKLRKKMWDMNNPTCAVVLYKLLGNEDEREALSVRTTQKTTETQKIELKFN